MENQPEKTDAPPRPYLENSRWIDKPLDYGAIDDLGHSIGTDGDWSNPSEDLKF